MFSVVQRLKRITQPRGGYINPGLFTVTRLSDDKTVKDAKEYSRYTGMAVDYLTRYLLCKDKVKAFEISLKGAEKVGETETAHRLLGFVTGLDRQSVYNACKLTGYDIAYRKSVEYFIPVDKINPTDAVIDNIITLVERSLRFFNEYGPVVECGFTFEGGYTKIVSKGDGDFLTHDALWDFKVSKDSIDKDQTLQILMYYIMGLHSENDAFNNIKKIGIFNPYLNIVYELAVTKIDDSVMHAVSRDVLGYKISDDVSDWMLTEGSDEKIFRDARWELRKELFEDTGFRPENYSDGIYDISVADYWSFTRQFTEDKKPKYNNTKYVKFLKNHGFIMFVSVSEKGVMHIMQKGALKTIKKPIAYYYELMPEFGNAVLKKFEKYWDALYSIAEQVRAIEPDENVLIRMYDKQLVESKEKGYRIDAFDKWSELYKRLNRFTGRVHGCIVDLSFDTHVYLNPFDGSVTAYQATNKETKLVYKDFLQLVGSRRPDMLKGALKFLSVNKSSLLIGSNSAVLPKIGTMDIDADESILVTDTSMYDVSVKMRAWQYVRDNGWITQWNDEFLKKYEIEG